MENSKRFLLSSKNSSRFFKKASRNDEKYKFFSKPLDRYEVSEGLGNSLPQRKPIKTVIAQNNVNNYILFF